MEFSDLNSNYDSRLKQKIKKLRWLSIHIDPILLSALVLLAGIGLMILYSASNQSFSMVLQQGLRLTLSFALMLLFAQISPRRYYQWAPWIYTAGVIALCLVITIGRVNQGARRWLDFGFIHFQPSEVMKIATPMMIAWFLSEKRLPPNITSIVASFILILIPALLIMKQPDLGTAIVIIGSAFSVLILAGISWRLIIALLALVTVSAPILWHYMHGYQRNRVLTFLNPERDPLGTGYHIIQSKIAIGSGGLVGKGWLNGTQSHLSFLPAHATDFIFAVSGEEFGFIGALILLLLFLLIFFRCFYISIQAQNTFTRLLAGSISFTFILSALVNIGMVIGILPVVGIPLPLVSYGGSYMVTFLAGFGIIMSIHTHRKLWSS